MLILLSSTSLSNLFQETALNVELSDTIDINTKFCAGDSGEKDVQESNEDFCETHEDNFDNVKVFC